MAKPRTNIPVQTAAEVLFAADNTCCVCGERGRAVQIHHLDENPTNHAVENLAVLCLECHNETQSSGGFGRKLTKDVVVRYRDEWIVRVRERRREIDRLVVERTLGPPLVPKKVVDSGVSPLSAFTPARGALEYINSLPERKEALLKRAKPEWDSGVTSRMVQASYEYIDALSGILANIASFYPEGHFGEQEPQEFFSQQVAARFAWHRIHAEPEGPGTGGTIVNVMCCGRVQTDLEKMVEDMVMSIVGYDEDFDWHSWPSRWHRKADWKEDFKFTIEG